MGTMTGLMMGGHAMGEGMREQNFVGPSGFDGKQIKQNNKHAQAMEKMSAVMCGKRGLPTSSARQLIT